MFTRNISRTTSSIVPPARQAAPDLATLLIPCRLDAPSRPIKPAVIAHARSAAPAGDAALCLNVIQAVMTRPIDGEVIAAILEDEAIARLPARLFVDQE